MASKRVRLVKSVNIVNPTTTNPTVEPQSVTGTVITAPYGYTIMSGGWSFGTPARARMVNSYPTGPDSWAFEWETYDSNVNVLLFAIAELNHQGMEEIDLG